MPQAFAAYLYANFAAFSWAGAQAFSYAVFIAASVAYGGYQKRKAAAKARAAANENTKDREVMIRSAVAPRRVIYGRDRVSGPVVFMQSTGDKKQYLHLVIALAAHQCDAIEEIYFNEIPLGTLDVDGFVTTGDFLTPVTKDAEVHSGTTTAGGELTLPAAAAAVTSVFIRIDGPNGPIDSSISGYSHTAETALITGLPTTTEVYVTYTVTQAGIPRVRVHKYLGGSGQAADADLISECGGTWTAAHIGAGITYLAVRLEYDQDIFGSIGIPNISAIVRGKLVLDPRTSTTAWSNNAALCVSDYLQSAEGMRATSTEVPDSEVIEAANICDETVDLYETGTVAVTNGSAAIVGTGTSWTTRASAGLLFVGPDAATYTVLSVTDDTHLTLATNYGGSTLSGQAYVLQQLRYTSDTSFTSDRSPRDVLTELAVCMAGRVVWTQGRWLVRAGAHRTPALTITDDMVVGGLTVVPKASRSDLFNAVRATYRSPTELYAEVQAPLVLNAGYETDDGDVRIVRQIDIPTLADTYRAQRLAKIELERARQALTVRLTTNLRAYDLAPTDTVMLTLTLYGWSAKVFEVVERTLTKDGLLQYTLRETASGVWAWNYGEATIGDLAPDTDLPSPFTPPALLTGLTITQDSTLMADGAVVLHALLEWTQSADAFVLSGGRIEVNWAEAATLQITAFRVEGNATSAKLAPLQTDIAYIARVRQVNAAGRAGDWAYISFIGEADTNPPDNVANLDWEIKPGQVLVTWDASTALDYAATELRVGASWAAGTFLWRGKGSDYKHARPPNGVYTVWAAHVDTSGNYSATPASISVTVDDTIDAGTGGVLRLKTDRFPFFSFADGTTHTASGAGTGTLTITAQLVSLSGTPTFVATARDSGGASLGTITLGGSGLIRTITAAQFVSLGTSGSVRTVDVVATLGDASDTLTIYRQDSTTTAPRIYLSNPSSAIATDENGEGGDYSDASTLAEVYAGTSNDTALWSFAIAADAGVTATINGGAGPVTGTGTVTLAVSAMTIPDGAVLVTATRAANPTLTATFSVTKNEGTGAYTVYWDPRAEIVLPLGVDGAVSSYADAYSSLIIQRSGGPVDTANWTYAKADSNVTSELAGAYLNRVDVTGVPALGTISTTVSDAITLPTGWTKPLSLCWGSLGWVAFGYHATVDWQRVQISSDFITWTTVDMGSAGRWERGAADGDGVVISVEFAVAGTNKVIRSADGGATWGAVASLGASAQWYSVQWMGDKFVVTPSGSTAARQSADGITWSAMTMPANNVIVYGGPGRYLAVSSGAAYYLSTNGGSTWGGSISALSGFNHYSVKLYRGRLVVIPLANSTVYYSDDGVTWATSTLQHSVGSGPRLCEVVSGVLYVVGSDGKVQFSTDGKTWRYAGAVASTSQQALGLGGYVDIQASLLGNIYTTAGNNYVRTPLLATSETEGFVTVTASKPGETDIVRALPVRRGDVPSGGFAFSAEPYTHSFPATSDGVVTDFSGGTFTARASRDGVDDTTNWTWAYTTTNLTPSSGASNVATITAFDSGQDTGTISYSASRAGYQTITGTLVLRKSKGTTSSGPRMGVGYAVVDALNTLIGVRFNSDGSVDVKRGSGSYTRLTQWAGAVVSGVGSSYWLYIDPAPGTHALSTGTTDTWLALSSARTYEMSDATSGIHEFDAEVFIGTSSAGADAVGGSFSMRLLVP